MYSIMWSEHCSYKSSKVHLRQFGDGPSQRRALLVGMGENAGVVDVGEGLAVTFKVESHNHPSYVEPYQGAATGIGGIVRDILTMGARPVLVMDPLRFGDADHPDTARVLPGIVAGIGGYGNCLGLPNVGGEVVFDPSYNGNPLVNALCLGRAEERPDPAVARPAASATSSCCSARRPAATASAASACWRPPPSTTTARPAARACRSATRSPRSCSSRRACEMYDADLVVGHPGPRRRRPHLRAHRDGRRRPLRHARPPRPGAAARGVDGAARGAGQRVAGADARDRRAGEAAGGARPRRQVGRARHRDRRGRRGRPARGAVARRARRRRPAGVARRRGPGLRAADVPPGRPRRAARAAAARPPDGRRRPACSTWRRRPNLCSRRWVVEQYDRIVLGNSVLAWPEDAGVVRLSEETGLGVALATDGNGRYTRLDPYAGAQLALAEAYRNVAATGAVPIAVTNCLNFGSPEDPEVMWQFAEATRGLADACTALGIPVTGGNVSFYNQTGTTAINPTPVVGVLGLFDDVARRTPDGLRRARRVAAAARRHPRRARRQRVGLGAAPPPRRHAAGRSTSPARSCSARCSSPASRDGMLSSAHDLSDGGLAQALGRERRSRTASAAAWCCPHGPDAVRAALQRVGRPGARRACRARRSCGSPRCAAPAGLPCVRIGVTDGTGDEALDVQDVVTVAARRAARRLRGDPAGAVRPARRGVGGAPARPRAVGGRPAGRTAAQGALVVGALEAADPAAPTRCAGWTVAHLDRHLGQVVASLTRLLPGTAGEPDTGVAGWADALPGLAAALDAEAAAAGPRARDGPGRPA